MIQIQDLRFSYPEGLFRFELPELIVESGEICGITGPSGFGKTTLLSLIAGILLPQSGRIIISGKNLPMLPEKERRCFRLENIGFIFQDFELLDYLNVFDNIAVSRFLGKSSTRGKHTKDEYAERVRFLASETGIEKHLHRYPSRLSRGEQQRVALCRGLFNRPSLILADEATGSLDPANRDVIRELLVGFCRKEGATLLEATHDRSGMDRFDRVLDLPSIAQTVLLEELP
ncbi:MULTISPECIES: ABC transporter ATP-binding protein [unclassified Oceanispirochaeta]|uniref:ABC transporter ATP-binding protein n=1 Tax=unclassified Oceanispirochaeta TaxID=2635722 RepID=UPI000E08E562|nr:MULTISPECIES: ATP-binding cassette domain-containing protein [unclassified Oceanispirochaeta]MBF9015206.1 ATP-binding cassette domain-containing protein [Oceanispirochaeta sp. M2]NPD71664.1 ATP-binding cassette domain-containing protein [Oceanispirochaeta sp. M1]RDG32861.1 ATP-binding cassette domain-containing protein [Oceanispirochaeta sp. M1]